VGWCFCYGGESDAGIPREGTGYFGFSRFTVKDRNKTKPMKAKIIVIVTLWLSFSAFGQGTLIFNNRTGNVDAPVRLWDGTGPGLSPGWTAQLFLVGARGTLTPLLPTTTFRNTSAAASYYVNQVIVAVPNAPAGSSATVRMRFWQGATTYDSATLRGDSNDVLVSALGGIPPGGGPPITDPILTGLQGVTMFPEPSTTALWLLGAAVLLVRRRNVS
jgi:hypothetical protein